MSSSVVVHPPNSDHPSLTNAEFPIDKFMRKWHVIQSTLPMWKNKQDVTITYSPIEQSAGPRRFLDIINYTSAKTGHSSEIKGVDTLNLDSKVDDPDSPSCIAARYKWRGSGLLFIASSKWQILGYGEDWAVTYFEKTLFTPAGLDIYASSPNGLSETLLNDIISKLKEVGDKVGQLAEQLFPVPIKALQ
ncbi:hypothetical protein SISNIDRAFT_481162 [Sistotremastrum niveocremeum HHB9708]|uniref:Uncharacterized protein n=2 Tax=Sistotremastraceae TaxID=3402574 RepID=A0A165A308_9AGAM|nr:hypothetical protein SISNIDRAFT_481162 [Sistotremastrum niveocremeum HHB9708]KZT43656.1 hypothetical protein SISSUDRAFT_1057649 [Sistotremastrum suecicum HHB10207 ss-3]